MSSETFVRKSNCKACGKPIKYKVTVWKDDLMVSPKSTESFAGYLCRSCYREVQKTSDIRIGPCLECAGTGKIKGYKCQACNGKGKRECYLPNPHRNCEQAD